MPLKSGSSDAAFRANVKTEVNAGRPLKQALAIAYSQKRKAEHDSTARHARSVHRRVK